MTYCYVITTDRELDVDDITADLGKRDLRFDIRPDDDWGTIRCDGEAHETFERLLAEIEGYCVRIVTESGEEFDAVLICAPGLVRASTTTAIPSTCPTSRIRSHLQTRRVWATAFSGIASR